MTNEEPRLWNKTPVLSLTIPVPNTLNTELMKLMALPSASTTVR